MLLKNFPHVLIPPLPPKTSKQTMKVIMKRERYFTRFLNAVCRSEELKSSQFLVDFLKCQDLKEWLQIVKVAERAKSSKQVKDLTTKDGKVNV